MLTAVLSAGNFVIGMGAFVVVGLIPLLAQDLGVSEAAASQVLTLYAVAYAIGSPLGVALTGHMPRRVLLAGAMVVFGLAAAVAALAPSFEVLLAARIAAALGAGIFTPVAAAVGAATAPEAERGRALARVFFGLTLAQVMGVPVGVYLAFALSWPWAFGLVFALALPLGLMLWRLVPADLAFQATALSALGAALRDLRGLLAVSFTAFFLGAVYVIFTFLAPLMREEMGYGGAQISAVLLIFGAGAVLGNLVGGWMGDRLGPERTLGLLALVQIGLMPLFSALPVPDIALWALVLLWSMAGWSFMAPQQMRLMALAPERQGVMLALNAAAIYVGAAWGGALGAAVIAGPGTGVLGVAAGAAGLLALGSLVVSQRLARRA